MVSRPYNRVTHQHVWDLFHLSDFLIVSKINQGSCLGCLGGNDAPVYEIVKIYFKKSKFNCKSKFSDIVTRTRIQKAVKTRENTFRQQKQRTFGQFL